jgi:hypothetical protein
MEFPTQRKYSNIKWSNHLSGKISAMDEEGSSTVLSFEPEGLFTNPGRPYSTPNISA